MNSLAKMLADRLYENDQVRSSFLMAHVRVVCNILSGLIDTSFNEKPDWAQLLAWASVFAQSDVDEHVELSLIAAVSALLTSDIDAVEAKYAAAFVLEICSNSPTLKLAQERNLVGAIDGPIKTSAILKSHQRRLKHFVFDDAKRSLLVVTSFQERAWEALTEVYDAALSAPTSAGKSFVLIRWLVQSLLKLNDRIILGYIVPSRALIRQVRDSVVKILSEYDLFPRIVTLPTLFPDEENRSTILIMTQERIERLFSVNRNLVLGMLVVDEAHKLGEGSRGVILQRVIDETIKRSKNCHVILAAPHASNTEILMPRGHTSFEGQFISRIISDSRPTVLQNLFWINPIKHRSSLWSISLVSGDNVAEFGSFHLSWRPSGIKKQLAAIAYHIGGSESGNIVLQMVQGKRKTSRY